MPNSSAELWWILVVAGFTVLLVVAIFAGSVLIYHHRLLATTRDFHRQLLQAHENERTRIARDLHDDVVQRIVVLGTELDRLAEPRRGSTSVDEWARGFRAELQDLAGYVREMAHRMHPSILENLGLVAALHELAHELAENDGLVTEVTAPAELPAITPDASLCLYRAAQEGLRNVVRHARRDRASLRVRSLRGGVELVVEDHGIGQAAGPAQVGGLGLRSLQERLYLVHGVLTSESRADGFRLCAWVPGKVAA